MLDAERRDEDVDEDYADYEGGGHVVDPVEAFLLVDVVEVVAAQQEQEDDDGYQHDDGEDDQGGDETVEAVLSPRHDDGLQLRGIGRQQCHHQETLGYGLLGSIEVEVYRWRSWVLELKGESEECSLKY